MGELHGLSFSVFVSLVHAVQEITKRVVTIARIIFVYAINSARDLGDGHSLLPHLCDPVIWERAGFAAFFAAGNFHIVTLLSRSPGNRQYLVCSFPANWRRCSPMS